MKEIIVDAKANRITIMADDYLGDEEFRKTVSDAVLLLLKVGYKLKIYTEIPDEQVIIDFTRADESFGTDIVIVDVVEQDIEQDIEEE